MRREESDDGAKNQTATDRFGCQRADLGNANQMGQTDLGSSRSQIDGSSSRLIPSMQQWRREAGWQQINLGGSRSMR